MILLVALILPLSQLRTQQVTTLPIRPYIEYLMQTYILLLILLSKLMKNLGF